MTANNKVWRKFTFSPITTSKIRVYITAVPDAWSRVMEIQALGTSAADQKVQWLISDQLGTPRMVLDQSGALANMKRHDYLPFGEELLAPVSGRSAAQGYAGDGVRQQFTAQERDVETGLDYFIARYYSSSQARFTSPDPLFASGRKVEPQSWNRYTYVLNRPLGLVDPNGLDWGVYDLGNGKQSYVWFDGEVGTYKRRKYTPVAIPKDGLMLPLTDGTAAKIYANSNEALIYRNPTITVKGQDTLNFAAGLANGVLKVLLDSPFGGPSLADKVTDQVGGVERDSTLYQNGQTIGQGVTEGSLTLATPAILAGAASKAKPAAAAANTAVEGIYEFNAASGRIYVRQSSNIPKRIEQHLASGKLLEADLATLRSTTVSGGKTAREVAEQLRINQLGGISKLENVRNPIGKARAHLLQGGP